MATLSARTLSLLAEIGPSRAAVICTRLGCPKDTLKATLARLCDAGRVTRYKNEIGTLWGLPVELTPAGRIESVTFQWVVRLGKGR